MVKVESDGNRLSVTLSRIHHWGQAIWGCWGLLISRGKQRPAVRPPMGGGHLQKSTTMVICILKKLILVKKLPSLEPVRSHALQVSFYKWKFISISTSSVTHLRAIVPLGVWGGHWHGLTTRVKSTKLSGWARAQRGGVESQEEESGHICRKLCKAGVHHSSKSISSLAGICK